MSILLCSVTPNNAVDERNPASKVRDAYRLPKSKRLSEIRREPSDMDHIYDTQLRQLVGGDYLK